ncbi:FxLYD domain-containing protein [Variovorax sp. J22R24]|uniref:FxLYD domain-containing protein n=1 Tax=Variovorax gracilis TaxID=3053502 RepID=UPI0025753DF7|nr:FxLYD domain-containing protein [Variovorax sp. J22R24]MDM0109235.1 FxLYD domain-containing protein [Variovorax sp. J22R24]
MNFVHAGLRIVASSLIAAAALAPASVSAQNVTASNCEAVAQVSRSIYRARQSGATKEQSDALVKTKDKAASALLYSVIDMIYDGASISSDEEAQRVVLAACSGYIGRPIEILPVRARSAPGCVTNRFTVVEKNTRTDGSRLYVTAVVRNDNPVACAVKMQVSVLDRAGKIVGTEKDWVAGENIAPGATRNFSIPLHGGFTKAGAGGSYVIEPIESRVLPSGPR